MGNRRVGMAREISLGRVTTLLLLGRVGGYALTLGNSVILARVLGVDHLGTYAYAMGVTALFALLPNMGISTIVTRTIAQDPATRVGVVRAAVRAQALLAIAVLIIIPAFAALLPGQPVPLGYIVLAAAQLALGTMSWPYLAVLGGWARYDRVAIAEITAALTGTGTLLAAAVFQGSVAAFLWAQVLAAGIAVVTARRVASPFLPTGESQPLRLSVLFRQAAPFGVIAAVQSLYTRLDMLLLGQMASIAALGLYSVAYKPINMVVFFGNTIAGVLFPFLVGAPDAETPVVFYRAVRGLGVAAPAMALLFSGLAVPILRVLYGAEFVAAAPVLVLLAWSAAINWLYAPLGVALQARGKERWWLTVLAGGCGLNAVGNLWAIPRWGAVGAAVTTLVSEIVLLGLGAVLVRRELGIRFTLRSIMAGLSATTAGGIVLVLLGAVGPVPAVLAAFALYSGFLLLLRLITLEDLAMLVGWAWKNTLHPGVNGH